MGSHVDDSEDDHDHPVVSFSLGRSAVFVVGTLDRDEKPVPVLLRSGDVMLLSGDARMCYHGIAAILPGHVPLPDSLTSSHQLNAIPLLQCSAVPAEDLSRVETFLSENRINANVRQVLRTGCVKLQMKS